MLSTYGRLPGTVTGMNQVLLISGDEFNEFLLPCEIAGPECTGREGPTGLVTLLPNYNQIQCCYACFEMKTRAGHWTLVPNE
jgi:hypothetical protein